ncbi:MAG TPA: hypothetical protein VLJ37_06470 [bacterium]|nr:hypothetical protein [bacterium]
MKGTQRFVGLVVAVLAMGFAADLLAVQPVRDGCAERCGQGDRKSLFCHVPQGNPENVQEICIADSSVPKHLEEHEGDHCGACEITCEEIVCCPKQTPAEVADLSLQSGKLLLEDSDGDTGELCCEPDRDGDGQCGGGDLCPNDPDKTVPGACGCGVSDADTDKDGAPDCNDDCSGDPAKTNPGICGCGVSDNDSDGDTVPDCNDVCPDQPNIDTDGDETLDCLELCPDDPAKTEPGVCGCGVPDADTDGDGTLDCNDNCPNDPAKTSAGICGCGTADTDSNGDGIPNCNDDTGDLAGESCISLPGNQPAAVTFSEPRHKGGTIQIPYEITDPEGNEVTAKVSAAVGTAEIDDGVVVYTVPRPLSKDASDEIQLNMIVFDSGSCQEAKFTTTVRLSAAGNSVGGCSLIR